MNKDKLIENAKKILDALSIEFDKNAEISFVDSYPQSLIEIEPELIHQISIYFESIPLPWKAFGESIVVAGDLRTGKLTSVVTKGARYKVPEELQ